MKRKVSNLKHTSIKLASGGEVIVLDTGSVINAEAEAMLQALHSRSTGGLRSHLEVLAREGPNNFMSKFYVGYGHKSIGDCGSTTIFLEGVSMLVAKAIQDGALYCGQESSTRYVDFSEQLLIDPTETTEGKELLEMQRKFYLEAFEPTKGHLMKKYPRKDGENEEKYQKAIKAAAFDIVRSLLPAGSSTNLAWHTNLRQAADRLLFLRHHPLPEVREAALGSDEALKIHHPNSFGHKLYPDTEIYQTLIAENYLFHNSRSPKEPTIDLSCLDMNRLNKFRTLLMKRPPKTELPRYVGMAGVVNGDYRLDFASFRDIQRHRAMVQRMPLLTTQLGFNQWYVDNLPAEVVAKLPAHLQAVKQGIASLKVSKERAQYYTPMGYNTSNQFSATLPSLVYTVETRDSRFTHPTLQRVANSIGNQLVDALGVPIHVDKNPNRFDIKRGSHDITLVA